MSNPKNRRDFLVQATASAAAVSAIPYWTTSAHAKPAAAVDRFNIGCIGMGGMGMGDAHDHARFGDIVAVCDVDANHRERARVNEHIGKGKAESVEDYRRVLDRKDTEVVSIVTPDHWHTKIAIEALQAGKHVFCQKPLTLTLEENRLIRAACKANPKLVFFIGTQQRSDRGLFMRAVNMAQKGLLGDLKKITCGINGSPTGGPFAKSAPPSHLNWDMWLGQAPKVDYIPQRCHGDFRWWYEYSGGKFTDWGAHHIDIALWAAGLTDEGSGPIEVDGSDCNHPVEYKDGNPLVDDHFNTSHDFNIVHTFGNGLQIHVTSRGDNGVLIEGTKGRIFVNRERITGKPIEENWDKDKYTDAEAAALYKGKPYEGHKDNFYRCIREGGLPVSDVYSHLQTMNLCHLSAIAGRLKRTLKWNAKTETIEGDAMAAAMQKRTQRTGYEIPRVG
ncbi:MAG: Gfo/Idh/MocA family oxidoreductase [Pirellula sp.]|jgi:predicted dehydrogenase|nr:Gfo/Idh/MocA family oxidoreductase [Pirellula sp.]